MQIQSGAGANMSDSINFLFRHIDKIFAISGIFAAILGILYLGYNLNKSPHMNVGHFITVLLVLISCIYWLLRRNNKLNSLNTNENGVFTKGCDSNGN